MRSLRPARSAAEKAGFERMKALTTEQLAQIKGKGIQVAEGSPALIGQLKQVGTQMQDEWKAKAAPEQRTVLENYAKLMK